MGVQVVWFKRDLRVADHAPLREAVAAGPVVALWVVEDRWWAQDHHDASQLVFATQCARVLDRDLVALGHPGLTVRRGRVLDALADLHATHGIDALWSHQETGDGWTFGRDRAVRRWCVEHGVPWHERRQQGVFRPHPARDGWASRWTAEMATPPVRAPERIDGPTPLPARDPWPTPEDVGLGPHDKPHAVPGGSDVGRDVLQSFLTTRGVAYRTDLSSPVTGWDGCSRLAPHLTWGSVSLRTAWHATMRQADRVRRHPDRFDDHWGPSLEAFAQRLRWRDHFIQKLEDAPSLEFRHLHPAYDGLRPDDVADWTDVDHARFEAWKAGRTGFPMADACMRCLHAGGWLNFRMRAMLVSFASYPLWLPWRPQALWLSKHFLDYEPGIHFPQVQMQAGTTGINALRIYDPAKQQRDHDPDGVFVRRWVPELAGVPSEHLAHPERMDTATQRRSGCVVGVDYPAPIVAYGPAVQAAKQRLAALRRRPDVAAEARRVHHRHGSRAGPMRHRRR